jgi:hypothetical protein
MRFSPGIDFDLDRLDVIVGFRDSLVALGHGDGHTARANIGDAPLEIPGPRPPGCGFEMMACPARRRRQSRFSLGDAVGVSFAFGTKNACGAI